MCDREVIEIEEAVNALSSCSKRPPHKMTKRKDPQTRLQCLLAEVSVVRIEGEFHDNDRPPFQITATWLLCTSVPAPPTKFQMDGDRCHGNLPRF